MQIIRKVYTGANKSLLLTIPKEVIKLLNLESGDNVVIKLLENEKKVEIKKLEI